MAENITFTVNEDLIRIDTPSGIYYLNAYKIYEELKFIHARENLKYYLDDSDISAADISLVTGDESYIRAWMNSVAQNASIAECNRQAAEEIAFEFLSRMEVEKR